MKDRSKKSFKQTVILWLLSLITSAVIIGCLTVLYTIYTFTKDLPNHKQLVDYKPPVISRIYTPEGDVMAEYAHERRIFIAFDDIPPLVTQAFLAAEDKNFFQHPGIDIYGISRAVIHNLINRGSGKLEGGSTITQQLVKCFFLNNERSVNRKIKEAILAYRLTKFYPKEKVLELYLNKIFLGNNSYGIAAAANTYFGKTLDKLNVEEIALLAALPKAPSALNPVLYPDKAVSRRDWVIKRMAEDMIISRDTAAKAVSAPLIIVPRQKSPPLQNSYYSNYVRQQLIETFGEENLNQHGLIVNTYIDLKLQQQAESALRYGITRIDRQKGWRGPITNINLKDEKWQTQFNDLEIQSNIPTNLKIAIVVKTKKNSINIQTKDGVHGKIDGASLEWVAEHSASGVRNHLKIGDVILVEEDTPDNHKIPTYHLRQIPKVNGAIVAIHNYTGHILAMVGGYPNDYFNRAVQAKRQPGSAFKTFIYLTALENGFDKDSTLLDTPLSLSQGAGLPMWEPQNYRKEYLGPVPLSKAFAKSLNIPTIRLFLNLGSKKIMKTAIKLGLYDPGTKANNNAAVALGTLETTPLKLTIAHAVLASGGYHINPRAIASVYDYDGNLLYYDSDVILSNNQSVSGLPKVEYFRKELISSKNNSAMLELMRKVVSEGTGIRALDLKRDIVGKTGTTNESRDTWFIGSSNEFTVGVYVGHDQPETLGSKATGSSVALPIFIYFMRQAMQGLNDSQVGINYHDFIVTPL